MVMMTLDEVLALAEDYRSKAVHTEAVQCLEQALKKTPKNLKLWHALIKTVREMGEFEGAEIAARHLLTLMPNSPQTYNLLGAILQESGKSEEAIQAYEKSIELNPDYLDPWMNRGLVWLEQGKLKKGWKACERGLHSSRHRAVPDCPLPLWQGQTLETERLLLISEQGIGDELLFLTCLPDLLERIHQITLVCSRKIEPLFQRTYPSIRVIGVDTKKDLEVPKVELNAANFWLPVGSLPLFFRPKLESFPSTNQFLQVNPEKKMHWENYLRALPAGENIGIAWRSVQNEGLRRRNYPSLEVFAKIFESTVDNLICLQPGLLPEEEYFLRKKFPKRFFVLPELNLIDDLDHQAALISQLDCTVSAATSTALLAGSVGCPTRVLHYRPTWHMLGSGAYPWFPMLSVFFAETGFDWGRAIRSIREETCSVLA